MGNCGRAGSNREYMKRSKSVPIFNTGFVAINKTPDCQLTAGRFYLGPRKSL